MKMIKFCISILLLLSTLYILGYQEKEAENEYVEITNKEHNISYLLSYKKNVWGDFNKKEFIEYMKNEYCSKNTTKADIKLIKDVGYINIKCNKGFSKSFIHFLNKYNCINSKSDRVNKLRCILVYKDVDGMKDVKFIKDTDNYKEITIEFRG